MKPTGTSRFPEQLPNIIVGLLPWVILAIFWNDLPETIPTHWNIHGEADAFGSKTNAIVLPLVMAFNMLLFSVIPYMDPKADKGKMERTANRILVGTNLFLLILFIGTLMNMMGHDVAVDDWVVYGLLILFAVIGNIFGKIRQNYFMGIRTPWTLSSEQVWLKTHRVSGKVWFYASVLMLPMKMVLPKEIFWISMIAYILLIVIFPFWYSYSLYKEEQSQQGA
ncbi:SdpI family protein [Pontibacter sp. G13]|uniref:SdpI family protein n=1 Tax=Pontibacter sp. G13 TaxID=3074898 RepID=UPI00288A292F|nr:SdpI family protein [Pontibacter sp. G13]WNJ16965.1 SdpI family protein [Pontibacter sp. G13]